MSFISSSYDENSEIVIPTASEEEYRTVQALYDKVKGIPYEEKPLTDKISSEDFIKAFGEDVTQRKFNIMREKEEKADKQCRGCGITYPFDHLEKITLGNCYLKLCPRCYSEFSKQFINKDNLNEEIEKAFHSSDDLIEFYWFVKQLLKDMRGKEK